MPASIQVKSLAPPDRRDRGSAPRLLRSEELVVACRTQSDNCVYLEYSLDQGLIDLNCPNPHASYAPPLAGLFFRVLVLQLFSRVL